MKLLLTAILLATFLAHAPCTVAKQAVTGRFRPEKHQYLVGEPIVIIYEVFNHSNKMGEITESGCKDTNTAFDVNGATPIKKIVRFTCGRELTQIFCLSGGRDIPAHGKYTKRMLLDGPFVLDAPGTYHVRAKSEHDIGRSDSKGILAHLIVESDFDLVLRSPEKGQLEAVYKPLFDDLKKKDLSKRDFPVLEITQNPPSFAEAVVAALADDPRTAQEGIEGLGRLGTPTARATLIRMASTGSEEFRQPAIQALGELGNPSDCQSLLDIGGRNIYDAQEDAYVYAGRICKDRAVPVLAGLLTNAHAPQVGYLAAALENTRSGNAIPPLIGLLTKQDKSVRAQAEESLATLTHRKSQYGTATAESSDKSRIEWSNWWTASGGSAPIYGPDQCVDPQPLP